MVMYIEKVIVPFVNTIRNSLGVDENQAALAIYDHFKGQLTEKITMLLDKHNIQSVLVPPSCTDRLQPMDISVNKTAKSFLRSEFQKWYADEIAHQLNNFNGDIDSIDPVDITTARMKCVSAQWMVKIFENLLDRPDIIVNGFKAIAKSIDAGRPVLDDDDDNTKGDTSSSDDDDDETSVYFSSDDDQSL